jgi:hypothetical protein
MHIISKKKPVRAWLILLWVVVLCSTLVSGASAFEVPERLEYSIWWEFVKAGNSVLEIGKGEEDTLKIISTAWSSSFISLFYKVEDRIEVNVDSSTYLPYDYYLTLREGRHRKERQVTYYQEEGKIILDNVHDMKVEEFDIEGGVYDPLSAFYAVRTMDLEVGKSLFVRVFDNGKLYDVEVKVLKKEKITIPAGTFDTIKVKPLLMSDGIFMRKGDVHIWLSDDEKKVPVKIESEVKIGAINVVLKGGKW